MAEGTTAIDLALTTEGDADGTELIAIGSGERATYDEPQDQEGALAYIVDHEASALRKLAPPLWGKPFVAALLQAVIRELQTLEDTVWDVLDVSALANADLARLKVLGRIVGQPRLGFETERYRKVIQARALANVSRGRASDVIAVLNLLLAPAPDGYALTAMGNATLHVTALDSVDAQELASVVEVLPDVVAAGVGLQFLFSADPDIALWGTAIWGTSTWATTRSL